MSGCDQTQANQTLRSEAMFRIIFDNLGWGVEVFDENGRLIDINSAALEIFGARKEEMLGMSIFDSPHLNDEHKDKLRKGEEVNVTTTYDFDRLARTGYYPSAYRNRIKYLKSKTAPLKDSRNAIIGYVLLTFDDTEGYLKNEAIQLNLAKIRAAVDTNQSFLWEYNLQTKKLVNDFNLSACAATKDLISCFWQDVTENPEELLTSLPVDDPDYAAIRQFVRLKQGEIDHFTTVFHRMLDGMPRWFTSNIRTCKWDEAGKPLKIVCYTSDITQQKAKEMELFLAREGEKVRSAFMANISHEIRTPLNAIVGFSNILVDICHSPETENFREVISRNNTLLLQLVDDILDFSQMDAGRMEYRVEAMDIREVCSSVIHDFQPLLHEGVALGLAPGSPVCIIHSDRKRILKVILQLVGNAVKYTLQGHITLSYICTPEGSFALKVSDTGIGIPEKERNAIFQSFYQVDHFHQGVGMGLSIAKMLVEGMGGVIGMDSVEGEGSVFWFTIPVSPVVAPVHLSQTQRK